VSCAIPGGGGQTCARDGRAGVQVCAAGSAVCATTVVSLTFDDALAQQLLAAASLERHGMRGTFFLNTWRLQKAAAENMTPAQAKDLQARGHEIGGHTLTHPHLTLLAPDEQHVEICNDRANLLSLGLDVQNFAYPFGDWNADARQAVVDCRYNSARNVSGVGIGGVAAESFVPKDAFVLRAPTSIQSTNTVADIEAMVTRAEAQGGWLLLTFHHVCDGCASNAIRPDDLEALLDWLEPRSAQGTAVARVRDVLGGSTQPPVTWPSP
jgi:peptidoglycan/xylan/chitin deacetylase (PgdA/CDA1 family)